MGRRSSKRENKSKKKYKDHDEDDEDEDEEDVDGVDVVEEEEDSSDDDDDDDVIKRTRPRSRRGRGAATATGVTNNKKAILSDEDSDDDDDDERKKKKKKKHDEKKREQGEREQGEREQGRPKRQTTTKKKSYKEENYDDDDDEFVADEDEDDDDDDEFLSDDLDSDGEFANIRRSTRDRTKVQRLSPGKVEEIERRRAALRKRNNDDDNNEKNPNNKNTNKINYNEDYDDDDDFGDFIDDADAGNGVQRNKKKDGRGRPRKENNNKSFFNSGTPPSAPKSNARRQSGKWLDDTDDSDADGFDALPPGGAGGGGGQRGGNMNSNNIDISRFDALLGAPGYTADIGAAGGPKKIGDAKDAEITPLTVDPSLTFNAVGGLDKYVDALKEMVFLPLLYPEIFERFKMTPPRGVLLYGPPGTGKTLIARALAASCSRAGSEVSFFMRKGADVLSKWVGESERQLRLLFEEASKRQPSIIFFDEIDGLAPVRSSKSDQIHNSLVATLLALMDGLDNRGRVVVLGATNRVDSIDGALRRPGRFDRELAFPLPGLSARAEILKIHTRAWKKPPSVNLINHLAQKCVGYCGADLKALCTESAIAALRRRYPQIYATDDRLNLDPAQVVPGRVDFESALKQIVPAAHRSAKTYSAPLSALIRPLLSRSLQEILEIVRDVYPPAAFISSSIVSGDGETSNANMEMIKSTTDQLEIAYYDDSDEDEGNNNVLAETAALGDAEDVNDEENVGGRAKKNTLKNAASEFIRSPPSQNPRLLICGESGSGQAHIAPALLHALEQFAVHAISLPALLSDSGRLPEEALVAAVTEARRAAPSILYLPHARLWWESASATLRATLLTLLDDIPPNLPVMLIATSDCEKKDLDEEFAEAFASSQRSYALTKPNEAERKEFFEAIVSASLNAAQKRDAQMKKNHGKTVSAAKIGSKNIANEEEETLEVLEKAKDSSEKKSNVNGDKNNKEDNNNVEVSPEVIQAEEQMLRKQRMFLRDIVTRLLFKKQWSKLAAPITDAELDGYSKVVQSPMDLSTLLWRVDSSAYLTIESFLKDVHLIVVAAVQYWGEDCEDSKGRQFVSRAYALEDTVTEMCQQLDSRVIERCAAIAKRRFGVNDTDKAVTMTTNTNTGRKRQRSSSPLPAVVEEEQALTTTTTDVEMKESEEIAKKEAEEEVIKATFDLIDEASVNAAKAKALNTLVAKSSSKTCTEIENLAGSVGRKVQSEFAKISAKSNKSWCKAVVHYFKDI